MRQRIGFIKIFRESMRDIVGTIWFCYSLPDMNVRWLSKASLFVVLALVAFGVTRFPQTPHAELVSKQPTLRFGQSIALSDFDSDGLIDQARIDRFGAHQRVEIALSHATRPLVLCFDAPVGEQGSLVAEDVDSDGATDLVWTDLLHPADVIVWLGDGTGEFERVSARAYGDRFTLGTKNIGVPEQSNRESAINSSSSRQFDQSLSHTSVIHVATHILSIRGNLAGALSPTLSQPADRSPPILFS